MAAVTSRKLLNLFSYLASLLVAWLTGATSFAADRAQEPTTPLESSSWQLSRSSLTSSTSYLVPFDESLPSTDVTSVLERSSSDKEIVVAAYGSESPGATKGSGRPKVNLNPFVPREYGRTIVTVPHERLILENFLNIRVRIFKECKACETRVKLNKESPFKCLSDVLGELEERLQQEADRGSTVAQQALPVVKQMKEQVRDAKSGAEALAAIRSGISKVQQISLVQSQDTVIVSLQQQQRAVLTETLQAVEVSLTKSLSI